MQLFRVAVIGCLMALVGCSPSAPKGFVANGKATLDGQPLTRGEVVFSNDQGIVRQGTIRPDGTFAVPDILPGHYHVGLTASPYSEDDYDVGAKGQKTLKKSAKALKLPTKLQDPAGSGVTIDVIAGQDLVIAFKSE